jgi:hypothetical protein
MTFEERLDRIAAKHEALAESVELLAHQQLDFFAKMESWQGEMRVWQEKHDRNQEKNEILLAHVLESIGTLARVSRDHERRISDLEGPRPS